MNTDSSKTGPENEEKVAGNGTDPAPEEGNREQELSEKLQEAEKKYLYLYSEFENFRRRNERDRLEYIKFGHEGFLRELLQVLDNFERAISHAASMGAEKGSPLAQVTQGVEMILQQMLDTLRGQGVTPIQATGAKFDPALHEAVAEEEADESVEAGNVIKEAQRGYLLHGRLLRAAKVIVAKKRS
jgi:molecular chaperone GrpE